LTYKPVDIIDLTASQLMNIPSADTTVQELEDVLERRLTLDEIQVNIMIKIISFVSLVFSI
jgi:hypothetical protein